MPISIELAPPLAIVTVNNPPVNALSHAVREGLKNACEELGENDDIKAVV